MVVELDRGVLGERILAPNKENARITYLAEYTGRAPASQFHGTAVDVSGSVLDRKNYQGIHAVVHMQERTHMVPMSASQAMSVLLVRCYSPIMRHAEYLPARRAWCTRCLPGL